MWSDDHALSQVESRLASCIGVALRVPALRRMREIGFTHCDDVARCAHEPTTSAPHARSIREVASLPRAGEVNGAANVAGRPRVYKAGVRTSRAPPSSMHTTRDAGRIYHHNE